MGGSKNEVPRRPEGFLVRAALYVRVSSDEQAREGLSLPMQEESCRRLAESGGAASLELFSDEGYSGMSLRRPALQNLLARLPEFDSLYVYRMDRLARPLRDRLAVLDACMEAEVGVRSATEPIDLDTIMGRAMVQMMGVFAEIEVETLRARVRDTLAHRVTTQRLPHGPAAYGYRNAGRDRPFTVDPVESPYLVEMFRRYDRGESLAGLARWLNEAGAPCRRHAHQWREATIRQLLRNPVYLGEIPWHGAALPGLHDPLVPRALWERVQARLEANTGLLPQSRRSSFSPLFTCGLCGGLITRSGQTAPDNPSPRLAGYICALRRAQPPSQRHPSVYLSAPKAEEAVWRTALHYLGGELQEGLRLAEAQRRQEEAASDLPGWRARLRALATQQRLLLRGYSLGNIEESVYLAELAPLQAEKSAVEAQIAAVTLRPDLVSLKRWAAKLDVNRAVRAARGRPADMQVAFLRPLFPVVRLYPQRRMVFTLVTGGEWEVTLPQRWPGGREGFRLGDGTPLPRGYND